MRNRIKSYNLMSRQIPVVDAADEGQGDGDDDEGDDGDGRTLLDEKPSQHHSFHLSTTDTAVEGF